MTTAIDVINITIHDVYTDGVNLLGILGGRGANSKGLEGRIGWGTGRYPRHRERGLGQA